VLYKNNINSVDQYFVIWYNYDIMKTEKLTFKVSQKPHTRVHRVLWDRDLPFKPKTEKNKVLYKRHNKHKSQSVDL